MNCIIAVVANVPVLLVEVVHSWCPLLAVYACVFFVEGHCEGNVCARVQQKPILGRIMFVEILADEQDVLEVVGNIWVVFVLRRPFRRVDH